LSFKVELFFKIMSEQNFINLEERARIAISLGESHFREFKSVLHGTPDKKTLRETKSVCRDIGEALVAFANADGGELLIGVEDNGNISGVESANDAQIELFEKAAISHVHSKTPIPSIRFACLEIDAHKVLYFSVQKSTSHVHLTSDGRCVQRRDLETVPIPPDEIIFHRRESESMTYERKFIDNATANDLDPYLVRTVADQLSPGMSIEKCLQYLDLAEYVGPGMRLRRAALLLFAKEPNQWHPRLQIRIIKVAGTELGSGAGYNAESDQTVIGNILQLLEKGWDALRPQLVQTRLGKNARFGSTVMYPELACREALTNAIAHRDFSEEGRGIEIYVFDDRMEVRNPGALLSSVTIGALLKLEGVHQSRNALIARVLRELGYMQELGEGMRRMFELMRANELTPPELQSTISSFVVILRHSTIYNQQQILWLQQFENFNLDREQKAIVVLGIGGALISPQDIIDTLGIVDIEHYRQLIQSLKDLGILTSQITKSEASRQSRNKKISVRQIPRFRIGVPSTLKISENSLISQSLKEVAGNALKTRHQYRLWIGNLPYKLNKNTFFTFLSKYGEILDLFIPMSFFGESKGYAFVEFDSSYEVDDLIHKLHGEIYEERKLQVKKAHPKNNP
jgi:ATP-dependent DNA helicase RecG